MRCLNVTPAEASAELTIAASRISEKGRTFDCGSDLTFSEIHRRVAWDMVGLLVGQELQIATTNPCPIEADICLSQFAQSTYGFPSAIPSVAARLGRPALSIPRPKPSTPRSLPCESGGPAPTTSPP